MAKKETSFQGSSWDPKFRQFFSVLSAPRNWVTSAQMQFKIECECRSLWCVCVCALFVWQLRDTCNTAFRSSCHSEASFWATAPRTEHATGAPQRGATVLGCVLIAVANFCGFLHRLLAVCLICFWISVLSCQFLVCRLRLGAWDLGLRRDSMLSQDCGFFGFYGPHLLGRPLTTRLWAPRCKISDSESAFWGGGDWRWNKTVCRAICIRKPRGNTKNVTH